jgi:hypothetical protein
MTSHTGKIALLGLAGIGWDDLSARLAAGRLPAIGALVARGACGRLRPANPASGPAGWATIATGLPPDRHGIILSEEVWAGGLRKVGRASWNADPLWLRLADAGFATASIGWPGTTPGVAWPGIHVDPRFFVATGMTFDDWLIPRGAAPDDWVERLREVRVHPRDITGAMLKPFVPALMTIDQERDHRLVDLALMIARLSSAHAAAMLAIRSAPWDALFVHYRWLEEVQAQFGAAAPPFEAVVDAAWTLLDQLIGATVSALPEGATILIVSPGRQGQAGIFLAAGPQIERRGLRGLSSADVAPTLLAHFGLTDSTLPGRALFPVASAIRPAPPMRSPLAMVEPDAADLARVAAFGHSPPKPPPGWQARQLTSRAEMLLASDPAAAGRLADAALALEPASIAALGARAAAYVALEEPEPLPDLADRIGAAAPGHLWEALVRAGYHALRGEAGLAQPFLKRVEAEGGAEDILRAGAAWMMLGRHADAARLFAQVVTRQPDSIPALLGLAMGRMAKPLEAEQHLRRVLELDPAHAAARNALVGLLRETGRGGEAAKLLAG